MPDLSLLSNVGRFYLVQAQYIEDTFRSGAHSRAFRTAIELLAQPNLPLYYRGSLSLFLTMSPTDAILYSERAINAFTRMCEQLPGDDLATEYLLASRRVRAYLLETKLEDEKADREQSVMPSDEEIAAYLDERMKIESGEKTAEEFLEELKLSLADNGSTGANSTNENDPDTGNLDLQDGTIHHTGETPQIDAAVSHLGYDVQDQSGQQPSTTMPGGTQLGRRSSLNSLLSLSATDDDRYQLMKDASQVDVIHDDKTRSFYLKRGVIMVADIIADMPESSTSSLTTEETPSTPDLPNNKGLGSK